MEVEKEGLVVGVVVRKEAEEVRKEGVDCNLKMEYNLEKMDLRR